MLLVVTDESFSAKTIDTDKINVTFQSKVRHLGSVLIWSTSVLDETCFDQKAGSISTSEHKRELNMFCFS